MPVQETNISARRNVPVHVIRCRSRGVDCGNQPKICGGILRRGIVPRDDIGNQLSAGRTCIMSHRIRFMHGAYEQRSVGAVIPAAKRPKSTLHIRLREITLEQEAVARA